MKKTTYREMSGFGPDNHFGRFLWALCGFGGLIAIGLTAAYYMETQGHHVTGMTNQIVWGVPHVFAVFLIVAASGALNVASIASVFSKAAYKPLARFSALVALALLMGGLSVLVLDLGRPDRLIVALTNFNFSSIFAWNIFLYTGFLAIVLGYLWTMMDPTVHRFSKPAGLLAFGWRLALTTGTGLIFGFLVARQAYDAAVFAPMFIAMSFAFGLAIFLLLLAAIFRMNNRHLGAETVQRLGRLLGLFVAAVLYFTLVRHLTNLYAAEHTDVERFLLRDGGVVTGLFWIGQVLIGGVLPLMLLFVSAGWKVPARVLWAAALVVMGGVCQVYVIIIGGQSFPLTLFPGQEVTSGFFDGAVARYSPSLPEFGLGLGGVALALLIVLVGVKALPILPTDLSDEQ